MTARDGAAENPLTATMNSQSLAGLSKQSTGKNMKYWDDIIIGETARFPGQYNMTEDNIIEVGKEWDPYPFHTDPVIAQESIYGGLVASTVHLFAITVKLGHSATQVLSAVSSLGITDLNNHAPAYAGDTLKCQATFIEKRLSKSKPPMGIMTARSELSNQDEKLLFSYLTTALYNLRPE
ncbi:MAG: acyl dehydratase [Halioglobus sp.]